MNILTIVAIVYSAFLMLFVKKHIKGVNPASFFTFLWAIQIFVILIGWSDYLYFNYSGIFYILVSITCFDIGYLIIYYKHRNVKVDPVVIEYKRQQCRLVYFFVLFVSFFYVLYDMHRNGFGLSSLFSLESFVEMSNENSVNRYTGGLAERNILTNVLSVNFYACPLLGGLFYYYYEGKKKLWAFIGLFPSVIGGLVQGAKMGIIIGAFMWVIGYIIASELFSKTIKLKLRHIMIMMVSVFSFFMILFMTMMFRYGGINEETSYVVSGKITSYSLGHLPAFDLWFDKYHNVISDYTLGGRTFNGITNPLGILKRGGGIFDELVEVSPYGDGTNVYTVFRFFVEDFGSIGALLYLYVIGSICGLIYINYKRKRYYQINITLLSMIYFFISWSFVSSIFAYTTYIALVFYLYFTIFFYFKKQSKTVASLVSKE